MGPEFKSLMIMIIVLSPFMIPMFLILVSFSKKNLQGIVYLALLSITVPIILLLKQNS